MHYGWFWNFPAGQPTASRSRLYGRPSSATGGKPITAGATSSFYAANATVRHGFCTLATMPGIIRFGFSPAANALALLTNLQWAIAGTARHVISRNCALGSNGALRARCRSNREACTRRPTSVFWGCSLTTRLCESKERATPENPGQISIAPICGGNAETDLPVLADGDVAELHSRQRVWD